MLKTLTKDEVLALAQLSRLKLNDLEIEQYQKELSSLLAYVEQLSKVDTTNLLPTFQVTGLKNVMREDVIRPQTASPKDLMRRVPKSKDGYIQVERMI